MLVSKTLLASAYRIRRGGLVRLFWAARRNGVRMLAIESRVDVAGLTGRDVTDFMLACTDEQYQRWWPGTHLQLHVVGPATGGVGDVVLMDNSSAGTGCAHGVVDPVEPGRSHMWRSARSCPFRHAFLWSSPRCPAGCRCGTRSPPGGRDSAARWTRCCGCTSRPGSLRTLMPTCTRNSHCCGTISGLTQRPALRTDSQPPPACEDGDQPGSQRGGDDGRGMTVRYLPPVVCSGGSGADSTVTWARPRSVSKAVIPSRTAARTRSGSAPGSGRNRTDSLVGAVWTIWNSSTPGVRSTTVPSASGGTVTSAPAVGGGEGEHVRGPPLHPDRRCRVPTRTRIGPDQDAVADVVADDRLDAVGQVRHQHRVRDDSRRHGTVVGVDRFDDHPVLEQVQPALAAARRRSSRTRCTRRPPARQPRRPAPGGPARPAASPRRC